MSMKRASKKMNSCRGDKLAICGGEPVRKKDFPCWPISDEREIEEIRNVLEGVKWNYLTDGEKHIELEDKFAQYIGAKYAISTITGTAALEIALRAAGIGPGDEVIFQAYTCYADAEAVLHLNAVPIFVDIAPETYCMDLVEIEKRITPRTRAIVPIHWAGRPTDMDAIGRIAEKHDLAVVEDACLAHGAEWKGKKVGTFGDLGCFSFGCGKLMEAGEGGMIVTDNQKLAVICDALRNRGRGKEFRQIGWNYRLSEILAAVLVAQLERYPYQLKKRNQNGNFLASELNKIEGLGILENDPHITMNAYGHFVFKFYKDKFGIEREIFVKALSQEGVPCSSGWPEPLYKDSVFRSTSLQPCPLKCPLYNSKIDYERICPESEKAFSEEAIMLPHRVLLGDRDDIEDIIEAVRKIKNNLNELKEVER